MSVFDLLFLALLAAAAISVLAAGRLALRRQFSRAGRIAGRLAACAAVYLATVILISILLPRRVLKPDTAECFDDWCIAVAGFTRLPQNGHAAYEVALRLSSRARRVSQRENGLSVYLTDGQGNRYDPASDSAATGFDVLLHPGESVVVRRSFVVPGGAKQIGLAVTHEGGFPIGWFIIGYDTWFRKPAVFELRQ